MERDLAWGPLDRMKNLMQNSQQLDCYISQQVHSFSWTYIKYVLCEL